MSERVLGVLGGMGPLASAQFMLRLTLLTPAQRDQDHIPAVLWSDPRVPDRTRGRLSGGDDPLPWLLKGIAGLRAAGCGAIAIPCNTAHGWYQEMLDAAGVPILHIVDAAADDLRRIGIAPSRNTAPAPGGDRIPSETSIPSQPLIGLMGTQATLNMRLYQHRLGSQGWDCITPSQEQMDRLVSPAIALVKANRVAEAYAPLAEIVNDLASRGAAAVVLGCTEIPLGILAGPPEGLHVPVVDTIDALARAAIGWARG
jgi:aspartate racemase